MSGLGTSAGVWGCGSKFGDHRDMGCGGGSRVRLYSCRLLILQVKEKSTADEDEPYVRLFLVNYFWVPPGPSQRRIAAKQESSYFNYITSGLKNNVFDKSSTPGLGLPEPDFARLGSYAFEIIPYSQYDICMLHGKSCTLCLSDPCISVSCA